MRAQTVELTARTAIAGNFRKATTPRAAAKVRSIARPRLRATPMAPMDDRRASRRVPSRPFWILDDAAVSRDVDDTRARRD